MELTKNEFMLLCDIQNGHYWDPEHFTGLDEIIPNLIDSEDSLFEKWGIERKALIKKIKSFSAKQGNALRDQIIEFWSDK